MVIFNSGQPFTVSIKELKEKINERHKDQHADMMAKVKSIPELNAKFNNIATAKQRYEQLLAMDK